ncbi:polysaccharide deacetylase family protein [Fulvivirga kasyanovii]|uniref:Polysaccharide deacetylase-like protein n=1 Tax=Fulvivirga kasyanovii TaxID=396812 RepID=A0ABW9RR64_9BACT|nr:polysaccharide deacetylase family protein [Fulvivirga kasyanovii]MTI26473.1 polysaccharide deacetylase-like protein [Fulvivirga kasyanovii]
MLKNFLSVICCALVTVSVWGQGSKQMVITVDDLPYITNKEDTLQHIYINENIVRQLVDYKVPAIGFVNESKLFVDGRLSDPEVKNIDLWASKGLELGNHTYSHFDYNRLTAREFFSEIKKGERITKSILTNYGQRMQYFRHPFLHRGDTPEKVDSLASYLQSNGYIEAPVTIDNSEYIFASAYRKAAAAADEAMKKKVAESYLSYMVEKTKYYELISDKMFERNIPQILLIHDNLLNADYLSKLLDLFKAEGYEFISLGEALKDEAYQSEDKYAGKGGITWLHRWAITQKRPPEFYQGEPKCPEFVQEYVGISE